MSHILNLVERQLAMSNIRDRLAQTPSRSGQYVAEDGTILGPCLLVSRECGSGGGLVARRAGEILGWNVFDSRIVDEIARNAHVSQRLVRSVDEHVRSGWERTWHELLPDDLGDKMYLHHLNEVLMALGHSGNVVIVGRGAQYFLPPQCALSVRMVAPLDARVKRFAERTKLSLEEAKLKVEEVDRQRAEFVRKIFRKDVNSPLNQDIIINTGGIKIESTVQITLAALKEKFGAMPEKCIVPPIQRPKELRR
ncbi:MAG TPA: cytidylate kinase-like family protein [Alphaproteobacteria bacterium]|nr:cytidylate kinase-like family protein [Alphaproteobacteria bacterium]